MTHSNVREARMPQRKRKRTDEEMGAGQELPDRSGAYNRPEGNSSCSDLNTQRQHKCKTVPNDEPAASSNIDSQAEEAADPAKITKNKAEKSAKSKTKATTSLKAATEILVSSFPSRFKQIFRVHQALNIVYTFVSTRKQIPTTLENMRRAMHDHISHAVGVEDVAEVVSLGRQWIRFEYVDELELLADLRGAEREGFDNGSYGGKASRGFGRQVAPVDESVGGVTGDEVFGGARAGAMQRSKVLLFEFLDADLKREVQNPVTGKVERPKMMLRQERLKMPVYSQKQLVRVIERRDRKFAEGVKEFLAACEETGIDPEISILADRERCMPKINDDGDGYGELGRNGDANATRTDTLPKTIPKERQSIPEIVAELKASPWYSGQVVPDGHRVFEPQEAIYGKLDFQLRQGLVNALYNAKDIMPDGFYSHQAEAINALNRGKHVVVATSTSSGKSLIYQLPVLHELEKDARCRAMYIFPTKALAQDQRRSLKELLAFMPGLEDIMVETYDGDTDFRDRESIRREGKVIFTNPDMLHVTILPKEEGWREFFQNLKFVVGKYIDACPPFGAVIIIKQTGLASTNLPISNTRS